MDSQPPESDAPAASGGEDFVHIENSSIESLSESIVSTDEAINDAVSSSRGTVEADSQHYPKVLPEELSRNTVVLTCESAAEGGFCDVYLVGTAHVSQVII